MENKVTSESKSDDNQILTSANVTEKEEQEEQSRELDLKPVYNQVEIPDGGFQAWSTLAGA